MFRVYDMPLLRSLILGNACGYKHRRSYGAKQSGLFKQALRISFGMPARSTLPVNNYTVHTSLSYTSAFYGNSYIRLYFTKSVGARHVEACVWRRLI